MRGSRHSVLLRLITFVLLLRIGFDFGAHGLFVCDFTPLPVEASTSRLDTDDATSPEASSPDHCFCHALSVGAVAPVRVAVLTVAGAAVIPLPAGVHRTDRHPLDQPPRFAA
jgi:hypothetical protein